MQVLANQVNELSGLVRQVLEGGRRRQRSRSDSRRRSRSRRGRSTRPVPPPRTPSDPPRRSPTPSPRSPTSLTPYPEDQRQELEQLLFQQLHGRDGKPLCWNPDEDLLTLLTESVRGWSNRDRTLWLCDPTLDPSEQQEKGIRVDIRIRSHVRDTGVTGGRHLKERGWVKSSFYKPSNSDGVWDRLQKEVPMREAMQLPSTWSDLVIFSHRDHRASRAYMVLKGRSDVRDFKKPPIPPPPSRFMISTDDDFGDVKVVAPKTEPPEESTSSSEESSSSMSLKIEPSTDETSSTRVKSEPRCLSPVGLMARDPDGPNLGGSS